MTLPENRQPLTGEDLAKLHPSTWQAECEQLRARVATLEAENERLRHELADNEITFAEQIGALTPFEADQARAVLQQESGENDAITEVYRLRIAMAHALERLDASRFSNSEHQQAKDTLRAALEAKR